MYKIKNISMVVIMGENRGIGRNGKLLHHLPEDLKYFKELTNGHSVLMGRNTFESIGRALPNRINIILSKDQNFSHKDVIVLKNREEALRYIEKNGKEVFIIGGQAIYEEFLPFADKIYLSRILGEKGQTEADRFFPEFSEDKFRLIKEELIEENAIKYKRCVYKRNNKHKYKNTIYWIGAIGLAIAPWVVDSPLGKIIYIFALLIMTIQTYEAKLYNLVTVNIIGILGFIYSLIF